MKFIISIVFTLGMLASFSLSSAAASLDEARSALNTGQYEQAYEQANALGNSAGLLLAAEILNTKVMLGQSDKPKKDSKLAMALAQQVLAQNPDNAEAKMLYAFAFGFNARTASILKAWRKKLPQKIHAAILETRAASPDDPRGDALLGGWHLSVAAKAGASKAQKLYGANEPAGHELFKKAMSAAPGDVFIAGNYIMMLTALGGAENLQTANDLLQTVTQIQKETAPEQYMIALLTNLQKTLGDPKAAKKKAKTFLDW